MKKWTDNIKFEHLASGLSGGVVSTLCLHPFDLVKVRFQVNDGSVIKHRQVYNSIYDAFRSIVRKGGFLGLYQGVSPNIAGNASSWGLYFFAFSFYKETLKDWQGKQVLTAAGHLSAGGLAGLTTLALTNPIWVVKTRMCLQPVGSSSPDHYKGVMDGLVKLFKNEGMRGYYRGFVPGIFGCSHGAVQFMTYEELKKAYGDYSGKPLGEKLNFHLYVMMSALSKITAVVTTYPYQVVRSRLQDVELQRKYNGVIDIIYKIFKHEGMRGYYKGLSLSLLRVTPACSITFVVYENMIHLLLPFKGGST